MTIEDLIARAEREVLTITFWSTAALPVNAQVPTLHLSGRRLGGTGYRNKGDRFRRDELVPGIPAGTAPFSITTTISGVNPGDWDVTAHLVVVDRVGHRSRVPLTREWSWHHRHLEPIAPTAAHTGPAAFARRPGIARGAWTIMVALGIASALAVQAAILASRDLSVSRGMAVTAAAVAMGAVGAKLWYLVQRRRGESTNGWCIQGFVAGLLLVLAVVVPTIGLPVREFMDVSAPGLLLGMAIGRIGCFLAGCCVGRPTSSRFGVWSSDRRLGVRRIPTQLLESAVAAALGTAALTIDLLRVDTPHGFVFVAALAGYTLARQGVLRLRAAPRRTSSGTAATAAIAAVAAAASAAVVVAA